MVELSQLWLPVLLSAVAVFFLSFCMWMLLPHHKGDWGPLPDEDGLMNLLRAQGVGGGQFSFPHCSDPKEMKDPAYVEKYSKGPKGFLVLRPDGPPNMGASMATSFGFNLITALLVAFVARQTIPVGDPMGMVFRVTLTVAFLANSFGLVWGPIWFGRTWGSTLREMGDGLVYSLATAGIFAALWPGLDSILPS